MRNSKTVEQGIITIDLEMDYSDESTANLLEDGMNESIREKADDSFDELVKALGKEYIQEVLEVEIDEEKSRSWMCLEMRLLVTLTLSMSCLRIAYQSLVSILHRLSD